MTKRLENKKAIITGGTTGLGFASAKRYLEEGAQVLITGRTNKTVDAAVEELGDGAFGLSSDVTNVSDLQRLSDTAKEIFGEGVDILFANAGGAVIAPIEMADESDYTNQFDLNVKGAFFSVQKVLPLMRDYSSIIMTASSVHGKGAPGGALYFASKAAVRSFARSMAAELGPRGIRVNTISPGIVPTQFFANSNLGEAGYDQYAETLVASTPLARVGAAVEIAEATVYLGSDESSFVTATDLVVDGGWASV